MIRLWLALAGFLLLSGCQKSELKVLIGATTVVTRGAQPIEDSVVIIAGKSIRFVGMRKDAAIPQDSERVDLSGKWVVPVDGGRIAPGEVANLDVREGGPEGKIARRIAAGQWQD